MKPVAGQDGAAACHEPRLDVFWSDAALLHDTGSGVFEAPASPLLAEQIPHPESIVRLRNMRALLERGPVAPYLAWHDASAAAQERVTLFHPVRYLDRLRDAAIRSERLTATTPLTPTSYEAALGAAGAALAGLDAILGGSGRPGFALVRPPGHHAGRETADGYCLINHVAIVAENARAAGMHRVAIIDWDAHHGNGTQAGFYARDDVLTVSLHMDHGAWGPSHPETGAIEERGAGAGHGFNLNLPLPMGSGDATYQRAFDEIVAPAVRRFAPDLIVIASGVDAGQFDPGGRMLVTAGGFHRLAASALSLAQEVCHGRILAIQEGGYNPAHAAFCVHAITEGLAGLPMSLNDPLAYMPDDQDRAETALREVRRRLEDGGALVPGRVSPEKSA
jgi:acetoin utilization deacetylase AcuC-like enzyme